MTDMSVCAALRAPGRMRTKRDDEMKVSCVYAVWCGV